MQPPNARSKGRHGYVPYILTTEVVLGRRYYVAAYAPDPSLSFRAASADEAIRQLGHYLEGLHPLMQPGRYPAARTPGAAPAQITPR